MLDSSEIRPFKEIEESSNVKGLSMNTTQVKKKKKVAKEALSSMQISQDQLIFDTS